MNAVFDTANGLLAHYAEPLRPVLAEYNLMRLTDHWPVVAMSTLICSLIFATSALVSPWLFPQTFERLHRFQKINWHIHCVSMAHALLALTLCWPLVYFAEEPQDYINGYWPQVSNICAMAAGYFLWDIIVSVRYVRQFGIGFVLHGISSFLVYFCSFRPFLSAYGPVFLMFEASTPFLDLHWFMDKLQLTGSPLQLINGVLLLTTFFGSRIAFGLYSAYHFFIHVHRYGQEVPTYLFLMYAAANVVLNVLNIFWFSKMVEAIRRRFVSKPVKAKKVH